MVRAVLGDWFEAAQGRDQGGGAAFGDIHGDLQVLQRGFRLLRSILRCRILPGALGLGLPFTQRDLVLAVLLFP